MKNSITPPSEDDIKKDYETLYRHLHMKSVAAEAGVGESRFSKQRSVEAIGMRNPLYEVKREMHASKVTNQEEIGKWLVKEIFDYGVELGFVDEQPLDILEMAYERLRSIERSDIRKMGDEELTSSFASIAELENEACKVKGEFIAERDDRRVRVSLRDIGGTQKRA
jgi:hypothetical protein